MDQYGPAYEVVYKMQHRIDKTVIHLAVGENTTLCMKMGDKRRVDIWGELLTSMQKYVGCPFCVEGMHS